MWFGVVLVAASVLVGARLLGDADRAVPVWAVATDLAAGQPVAESDLVARQVRFVDAADADRYLAAGEGLPADAVLARDVGAGELLPRAAVVTGPVEQKATITFTFPGAGVPDGLRRGDLVDVYVTSMPRSGPDGGSEQARLMLAAAPVVEVGRDADSLSGAGAQQVTVVVPEPTGGAVLAAVVQGAKTDNIYLVRQG